MDRHDTYVSDAEPARGQWPCRSYMAVKISRSVNDVKEALTNAAPRRNLHYMKKAKRSSVRFTEQAHKRLNAIESKLIARDRRDVGRDDIINHLIESSDERATIEALSGGRK